MKQNRVLLRIWIDVTGLVVPSIVIAAYLLGWSAAVRAVLTIVCFAGVFSTWLITVDLPSWRATQVTRLRWLRGRARMPRRDVQGGG